MNSSRFRTNAGTKGGFSVIKFPDNGERVRSLLCGREALAMPNGMAAHIQGGRFNVGVGLSLTRRIWRAGGTPKTHLVLPFYRRRGAAVMTKHFLSASVTVRPFLVMSQYLSTPFVIADLTRNNARLYGLIKRGSGRIHSFKPERSLRLTESIYAQLPRPVISHGFSFEQSCE